MYATVLQIDGTWSVKKDVYIASRSDESTVRPFNAFCISAKVWRIFYNNWLYFTISCARTVDIELGNPFASVVKLFGPAYNRVIDGGKFVANYLHFNCTYYYGETVLSVEVDPVARGCTPITAFSK